MLPKINRFPQRLSADFFKTAQVFNTPLLRIFMHLQENEQAPAQVMIIVPKKVVAKAAHRSQVKRKIQELIRPQLPHLKGKQIVFYLKRLPISKPRPKSKPKNFN
jgi:ribonuclease P protein component